MLDEEIINQLDIITAKSTDLGMTRSEAINAILTAFLNRQDKLEKCRRTVILQRTGHLQIPAQCNISQNE